MNNFFAATDLVDELVEKREFRTPARRPSAPLMLKYGSAERVWEYGIEDVTDTHFHLGDGEIELSFQLKDSLIDEDTVTDLEIRFGEQVGQDLRQNKVSRLIKDVLVEHVFDFLTYITLHTDRRPFVHSLYTTDGARLYIYNILMLRELRRALSNTPEGEYALHATKAAELALRLRGLTSLPIEYDRDKNPPFTILRDGEDNSYLEVIRHLLGEWNELPAATKEEFKEYLPPLFQMWMLHRNQTLKGVRNDVLSTLPNEIRDQMILGDLQNSFKNFC